MPTWRWVLRREPMKTKSSGKVKSLFSSPTRRRLSSQWNGPTFGPGWAWMVADGLLGDSFNRKFQYRLRHSNTGWQQPRLAVKKR